MQKVTQFLEQTIEYFCLGIAVLFVFYCVWAYLMQPVALPFGGQPTKLDEIDTRIANGPAKELADQMNNNEVPVFKVENFSDSIKNGLAMSNYTPPPIVAMWNYQKIDLSSATGPETQGISQITQLPVVPPATFAFIESGLSTVQSNVAAPAAAPAPGGDAPAAAAPAAAAPPGGPATYDINWVTTAFIVSAKQLNDEWTKAFGPAKGSAIWKLPGDQLSTSFLTVTAYRSEKLPNGTWGPDVEVERLFNNDLNSYPAANADKKVLADYNNWSKTAATGITTPPFPTLAPPPSGTVWLDPAVELQSQNNAPPAAAAPAVAPPPAAAPQPAAPTPRGGRTTPAPAAPRSGRGAARGAPAEPAPAPVAPAPAAPVVAAAAEKAFGTDLPKVPPVPVSKEFNPVSDPGKESPDILLYLHDRVQPGRTYRYRISYRLYNPIFNYPPDRAKPPTLVQQFALESAKSEWSPEVTPPPKSYFFCNQATANLSRGGTFNFEVLTWSQGKWNKKIFAVAPGDQIGSVDENGVDYSTGYTFIEARPRSDRVVNVMLSDSEGNLVIRNAALDTNSDEKKSKEAMVAPAAPAAPAVTPTPRAVMVAIGAAAGFARSTTK